MTTLEYFLLWFCLPLSVLLNCISVGAWMLMFWKDEVINAEEDFH